MSFEKWKQDLEIRCTSYCATAVLEETNEIAQPISRRVFKKKVKRKSKTVVCDGTNEGAMFGAATCVGVSDLGRCPNGKNMMRLFWKFDPAPAQSSALWDVYEDMEQMVAPGTRVWVVAFEMLGLTEEFPLESTKLIQRKSSKQIRQSDFGEQMPVPPVMQFTQPFHLKEMF